MKRVALFLALCLAPSVAAAQQLRGTVRDSASGRGIAGAVLLALDANGTVLGRNISDERGEYAMILPRGTQRLRTRRIGFRPRELPIPAAVNGVSTLDVAMLVIPTFLEPMRVTANACPRRSDEGSALALLEQARSGLLTAVVAREQRPAQLVVYAFEREMDGTSNRIDHQTVRVDSSRYNSVSFIAERDRDYVKSGFMRDVADGQTFLGPDADVLLDDRFVVGYCFRVVSAGPTRPNQVGLGFAPASEQRGRVDIDGVLWIDTVARALRDIDFKYTGLDRRIEQYNPGGNIAFRELPNGVVLVDRWVLRLIGSEQKTAFDGRRSETQLLFHARESGGELAHAAWSDGSEWHATLGSVSIRALTRSGRPAPGLQVQLDSTPYHGVTDANGRIAMSDLVPGAYSLIVNDSALATIGLTIPTDLWFTSNREALSFAVKVPSSDEFVIDRCVGQGRYTFSVDDTTRIIARAVAPDGRPLADVNWRLKQNVGNASVTDWQTLREGGHSGNDGVIPICQSNLRRGAIVEIELWHDRSPHVTVRRRLDARVNVIPVVVQP